MKPTRTTATRGRRTAAMIALLAVSLLGVPSSASTTEAGTFTGNAEVGKTFLTTDDCDKSGSATVVGEGLYLVGSPADLARARQGAWHLRVTTTPIAGAPAVLEACGWLGPADNSITDNNDRTSGIGPSCGSSKGHNGMGQMSTMGGTPLRKLFDLGWKAEVGMTVTMTGNYQEYVGGGLAKGKKGTVVIKAANWTLGRPECLGANGLKGFGTMGTYELINVDASQTPKMQRKECKETDPNADKVKDQDPGSDPDFKRPCPSGRK